LDERCPAFFAGLRLQAEKGFTTVLACARTIARPTTPLWIVDPVIMFVVDSVITAAQRSEIIFSHWNELILSGYLLMIVLGIVLLNSWEQQRVFEDHFWPRQTTIPQAARRLTRQRKRKSRWRPGLTTFFH
jgi:hypothetical protein